MERIEHHFSAQQCEQALADAVALNRRYPGLVVAHVRGDPNYPHICCQPEHYKGDGARCCSVCGYPVGIAIDGMSSRGIEILRGLMTAAQGLANDTAPPPIIMQDHTDDIPTIGEGEK